MPLKALECLSSLEQIDPAIIEQLNLILFLIMIYETTKKKIKTLCQLGVVLFFGNMICAAQGPNDRLITYTAPKEAVQNTDFTVKVRVPDGKWQDLPEYMIKVDEVLDSGHVTQNASMSFFDFLGEVEVSVTYNRGVINTSRVRPLSYGIKHEVNGNTLSFKLTQASNLSIEVNGDIMHNLHLFANPVSTYVADKKDKKLIYFGPGFHTIPGGKLEVPSGSTVYIDGGAIVMGQIKIEKAENVKVLGSGMVDQSVKGGLYISNSKNVHIEGLFSSQCFTGGSDGVVIRNVKVISFVGWGDGMNVISSNNVLIDRAFNRNSDDCTTVYGTRLGYKGGSANIIMQNSTLWADVGHPILVGTHGSTIAPEIIENLTYKNIDILDHKERQIDYQGCLSLNAGDSNLIRNVKFENIRIEDFRQGQLVNIRVFFNSKYCTSPGRGIENILFKDITYNGSGAATSIIAGYDNDRKVKNLVFENLTINGVLIYDDMPGKPKWFKTSDMAGFFAGEHVEGITFSKTKL